MLRLLTIAYLFLNVSLYAQVKISDLPAAGAVSGTEVFPIVQSATTKKLPVDSVRFWKQNGSGEIYRMSNVGIGITNPAGKLHIVDGANYVFDSTGAFLLIGNDTFLVSGDGVNAFSNIGAGSGYMATLGDTIINLKVTRGDTIGEYINYGWAWGLAGSTASADSVARLRWDGRARAWKFGIDSGNTFFIINADDATVEIPSFAGSAQKFVTADATGVLDTASMAIISPWIALNDSVAALVYNGDTIKIGFISGLSLLFTNDLLLGNTTYNIVIENNNDGIQFTTNGAKMGAFTNTTGATQTGLYLYDADNNFMERVTVGAADSGGAGFKVLRIPN